ncbi:hypothetical protein Tco_0610676 [Tanacetum coccineum]
MSDLGCYGLEHHSRAIIGNLFAFIHVELQCHELRKTSIRHESLLGADDEEISEGGIPRVIVYGYDGLPIQPVAPPSLDHKWDLHGYTYITFMSSASSVVTYTSVYTNLEPGRPVALPSPDYVRGPEEPQTPPVPQDEDEQDEHEFPAEEQPLPPVDSPTAESPGYVTESDPEEDQGDEDDEDEEEEKKEHLALAESAVVVPADEPVPHLKGTEPLYPPPSTDYYWG